MADDGAVKISVVATCRETNRSGQLTDLDERKNLRCHDVQIEFEESCFLPVFNQDVLISIF